MNQSDKNENGALWPSVRVGTSEAHFSGVGNMPGARTDMPPQVGKYRITKWLGSGGMGEVWLAEDDYGNEVAIKMFSVTGPSHDNFLRLFMREAHTLSMLQHRNICRIYGVEESDGKPFIIMEYVQGMDLATLLAYLEYSSMRHGESARHAVVDLRTAMREIESAPVRTECASARSTTRRTRRREVVRTLPLQQALAIVIKLCDAVQYAHERGVFHRDIKPSNIMVRPDGEPVLMDFGVAKLTGETAREAYTRTGQIVGTIEYMAPEQELSSRTVDERADVYSLGAVLYELVCGRRFFESTGALLEDMERLRDYVPVRPRVHSRHIDRELQAIILKAVAADKEQRYRSASSLGQDLARYQQGQPVMARAPTVPYLVSKFVRRNALGVALSSVIVLLTLCLGGYYAYEYYRQWGNWVLTFEHDFVQQRRLGARFEFVDTSGASGRPWVVDSLGLLLTRYHWCWLRDVRVSGNVRVVVRLHYDELPDGVELAINSTTDSLPQWYDVPRGYSCQVGGYQGTLDFISINKAPGIARTVNPVPSRFDPARDVVVVFQRENERISLVVNGRKQVEERDVLPFWGPDFCRVGFRTFALSTHIRSISVYRMSLPQKASPLVAGDVLVSAGYRRDAIKTYLDIADDYGHMTLGQRAVARALHTAFELAEPHKSHVVDSILGLYGTMLEHTPFWQDVREIQILDMWRTGSFEAALRLLADHFRAYPASRIALELSYAASRVPVPDSVRHRLFQFATRTEGVRCLNGTAMPPSALALVRGLPLGYLRWGSSTLTDLSPLASSRLTWLSVNENRIRDLAPLWGQPLMYLNCARNQVLSLEGLANAPLRILQAENNRITDLTPLRYSPLEYVQLDNNAINDIAPVAGERLRYLYVSDNRITDLAALEGLSLRVLGCSNNRVQSLAPLRRTPLRELRCAANDISDLVPLRGMPLERLDITGNRVQSLVPLEDMPLRELRCGDNQIDDLSPLRGTALWHLDIHNNRVRDISPLAGMPLEYLDISNNLVSDFGHLANMKLAVLRCGGNTRLPLTLVRSLPLREFGCERSGLVDLWPLAGMKLAVLRCGGNQIAELGPLAGMPLQILDCSDNRIESLEPLRYRNLDRLYCARNRITSLEPLRGKRMSVLDCRDNPLLSLAPMEQAPPAEFLFFTSSLPVTELERLAAVWERQAETLRHARDARLLARINGRRFDGLRALATVVGDHAYLPVPWERERAEVAELCEAAGGYVLQIETPQEWFILRDLFGATAVVGTWAGIVDGEEGPVWENGSGPVRDVVVHDADGHWVYSPTGPRKEAGNVRRGFVIEWEGARLWSLTTGATTAEMY